MSAPAAPSSADITGVSGTQLAQQVVKTRNFDLEADSAFKDLDEEQRFKWRLWSTHPSIAIHPIVSGGSGRRRVAEDVDFLTASNSFPSVDLSKFDGKVSSRSAPDAVKSTFQKLYPHNPSRAIEMLAHDFMGQLGTELEKDDSGKGSDLHLIILYDEDQTADSSVRDLISITAEISKGGTHTFRGDDVDTLSRGEGTEEAADDGASDISTRAIRHRMTFLPDPNSTMSIRAALETEPEQRLAGISAPGLSRAGQLEGEEPLTSAEETPTKRSWWKLNSKSRASEGGEGQGGLASRLVRKSRGSE